jgi:arylsulfatase A-like enzyme
VLFLSCIGLHVACGGDIAEAPAPPNVVLVVADTLRADHLSCYGYERPTSPFLDNFVGSADRYTRCNATSPWTLPTHASLFTGLYPFQHHARAEAGPDGRIQELSLNSAHGTLAEVLGDSGYRTAAFASNVAYMHRGTGLDQGFGTYEVQREPASEKARRAVDWLDASGGGPFFLFVNFMDTHGPYNVSELPGARGDALSGPVPGNSRRLLDELYAEVIDQGQAASPQRVAVLRSQYDNGVAHVDAGLEHLVRHLEESGELENTIFVFTSDHGEFFGEHGLVGHSKDVYEETLHVPLVLKRPGQVEGRVLDGLVSSAEVANLIAAELTGEVGQVARAQFPKRLGEEGSMAELNFSRQRDLTSRHGKRFQRMRKVLYTEKFKFIWSSDGAHELYNLKADPAETRNLAPDRPKIVARFEQQLQTLLGSGVSSIEAGPPIQVDAALLQSMRGLGYVGHIGEEED